MAEILGEKTTKDKAILLMNCTAWAAMLLFAFHACTHMVAAGDTWVAMACGRHFVNHGVDTVEPFSFNSHPSGPTQEQLEKYPPALRPLVKKYLPEGWVDQNWLTQVIFYKLTTMFGSPQEPNFNVLVFWKFAINLFIIISLYYSSRLLGAGRLISAILTCAAMYVSRSFIDIRPAVFSNMLVPVYLFILVLAVHKNVRYVYFIVPLIVFWSNVHGGYLYMFITIAPFWLTHLATEKLQWNWACNTPKGLLKHTFIAGVLAFIAMVIFNPYHLTNLTHTFIITVSKHAEEWKNVNEWHGAFEFKNPVGDSRPFVVMFFAALAIMVVWQLIWFIKPAPVVSKNAAPEQGDGFVWPKIPLAHIFISLFTISMAVRSRRFIPIASYAAAPLAAVMLSQLWDMVTARRNYSKKAVLMPTAVSAGFKYFFSILAIAAILVFAFVWSVKFNKVYLGPWPIDKAQTSVFMRMTASYAKPFKACEFIRMNKLSGRMLNYWTEGGFVAFYQDADEKTGQIPLKLFMDGRAQAAYNIEMFQEYNKNILSGGDLGEALAARSNSERLPLSALADELREVGEYLNGKLKQYDVWIILMPVNQQNGLFMKAINTCPNWKMAYYDQSQIILVDAAADKGKSVLDGIFNGKTLYPDENIRNIVMAGYYASSSPDKAWELASDAYNKTKSSAALTYLFGIRGSAGMEEKTYNLCKSIVSDYIRNQEQYKTEHGFAEVKSNTIFALNYILRTAQKREPDKVKAYSQLAEQLTSQRAQIMKEYNW